MDNSIQEKVKEELKPILLSILQFLKTNPEINGLEQTLDLMEELDLDSYSNSSDCEVTPILTVEEYVNDIPIKLYNIITKYTDFIQPNNKENTDYFCIIYSLAKTIKNSNPDNFSTSKKDNILIIKVANFITLGLFILFLFIVVLGGIIWTIFDLIG